MDNDEEYVLYAVIFVFCLLMLLFTSYNFTHKIPALVIIYGLMIITGLATFHAMGSAQESINPSRTDE